MISGSAMFQDAHIYYNTLQDYPKICVRAKEELRLLEGHPWAYSNELVEVPKDIPAGSVVTLIREKGGAPIGHAFFNAHSLIAARLLTSDADERVDEGFFERRIREAATRRALLLTSRNAARLVHGESDFLPGLIIDRYNDIISFQILSAGFEVKKEMLIALIQKIFEPKAIVEKNNSHIRGLEGLPQIEQIVFGTDSVTEIMDAAGTRFEIDVLAGQKTGFFLDQMENRTRLRDFIAPKSQVLDLFTNEGGFALNAALAGASKVLAVDASQSALSKVRRNAELNGVGEKIETLEADCFQFLRESTGEFDVIVLDPPALTKSRKDIHTARKGYLALNTNAMRLTKRGGILLTASCSHHVTYEMFAEMLRDAGRRSRRAITILETRGAGIDHPILAAMPETQYLKVFLLGVE